jgi:hypothetical protein
MNKTESLHAKAPVLMSFTIPPRFVSFFFQCCFIPSCEFEDLAQRYLWHFPTAFSFRKEYHIGAEKGRNAWH